MGPVSTASYGMMHKGNSDTELVADDKIKRVVMCSGKVYYDLLEERDRRGIDDVYLLRFEQFYPFPALAALKELERFKNAEMVWCQEEPKTKVHGPLWNQTWNGF